MCNRFIFSIGVSGGVARTNLGLRWVLAPDRASIGAADWASSATA